MNMHRALARVIFEHSLDTAARLLIFSFSLLVCLFACRRTRRRPLDPAARALVRVQAERTSTRSSKSRNKNTHAPCQVNVLLSSTRSIARSMHVLCFHAVVRFIARLPLCFCLHQHSISPLHTSHQIF